MLVVNDGVDQSRGMNYKPLQLYTVYRFGTKIVNFYIILYTAQTMVTLNNFGHMASNGLNKCGSISKNGRNLMDK